MSHPYRPTVLVSIEDPVLRMDIDMAFGDAGYRVVDPCPALQVPAGVSIDLALIDADPPGKVFLPLVSALVAEEIPCLIFSGDDPGGRMARLLPKAEFLLKPFASDQLVAHAANFAPRRTPEEAVWTEDVPAARSATG